MTYLKVATYLKVFTKLNPTYLEDNLLRRQSTQEITYLRVKHSFH